MHSGLELRNLNVDKNKQLQKQFDNGKEENFLCLEGISVTGVRERRWIE